MAAIEGHGRRRYRIRPYHWLELSPRTSTAFSETRRELSFLLLAESQVEAPVVEDDDPIGQGLGARHDHPMARHRPQDPGSTSGVIIPSSGWSLGKERTRRDSIKSRAWEPQAGGEGSEEGQLLTRPGRRG